MSSYNGLQVTLTGRNYHGLSFVAGYTYSHALADASDQGRGSDLSVPINNYASTRSQLYMATNYDLRHRGTLSVTYAIPGRKGFGQMLEGWAINSRRGVAERRALGAVRSHRRLQRNRRN